MKKAIICLFTITLVLSFVVPVIANDRFDHVKRSPNGKGDLIIFPFYLAAANGWETKLTVTNTHPTYSVVAKVVFHSMIYSEETFDFMLYLTPDDVWTGYLRNSGTSTILHSTDDSMLAANGGWASEANPVNQPLNQPICTSIGDRIDIGYIEVVESWWTNTALSAVSTTAPDGTIWRNTRPVSKGYLAAIYNNGSGEAPRYAGSDGQVYASVDMTINSLAGQMEFQNPTSGLVASMRAAVFADWDNTAALTTSSVSGFLSNQSRNTVGELEAAMSGNDYIMSYVNNLAAGDITAHLFTFPTKGSSFEEDSSDPEFCDYENGNVNSAFWRDLAPVNGIARGAYRCLVYDADLRDLQENGTAGTPYSGGGTTESLCYEVNILDSQAFVFNEGFVRFDFTMAGRDLDYTNFITDADQPILDPGPNADQTWNMQFTGVPALATIVYFKDGGMAMKEAARSDGVVIDANTPMWMSEYQYFNVLRTVDPPSEPGVTGVPHTATDMRDYTFTGPSRY